MHVHRTILFLAVGLFPPFSHIQTAFGHGTDPDSSGSHDTGGQGHDQGHLQQPQHNPAQNPSTPGRNPYWGLDGQPYPEEPRYDYRGNRLRPDHVQARFKEATRTNSEVHWNHRGTPSMNQHYGENKLRFHRDVWKEIKNRGVEKGNHANEHMQHAENKHTEVRTPQTRQQHIQSAANLSIRFWRNQERRGGLYDVYTPQEKADPNRIPNLYGTQFTDNMLRSLEQSRNMRPPR